MYMNGNDVIDYEGVDLLAAYRVITDLESRRKEGPVTAQEPLNEPGKDSS